MTNYSMYFLLQELRKQSRCKDKQVACIITDMKDNILSVGVNKVNACSSCGETGSKQGCDVVHAEVVAVCNLSKDQMEVKKRAYVSLYPCENCQVGLDNFVEEIIVFGTKHKNCVIDENKIKLVPNLVGELHKINGEQKQLAVITSELAELSIVVQDYFYRRHEREVSVADVLDEIIDVHLMTSILIDIIGKNYDAQVMPKLIEGERQKLTKVASALSDGRIKPGSPYSKSF